MDRILADTPLMRYGSKIYPEGSNSAGMSDFLVREDTENAPLPGSLHDKLSGFAANARSSSRDFKHESSYEPSKEDYGRKPLGNRTNATRSKILYKTSKLVEPVFSESDVGSPVKVSRFKALDDYVYSSNDEEEYKDQKHIKPRRSFEPVKGNALHEPAAEGARYYEKEISKLRNELANLKSHFETLETSRNKELEASSSKFQQELKLLQHEFRVKLSQQAQAFESQLSEERERNIELQATLQKELDAKTLSAANQHKAMVEMENVIKSLEKSKIEGEQDSLQLKGKYEALNALYNQLEKRHEEYVSSANNSRSQESRKIENLTNEHNSAMKALKEEQENHLLFLKGKWRQQADEKINRVKKKLTDYYEGILSCSSKYDRSPHFPAISGGRGSYMVQALTDQVRKLESALEFERDMAEKQKAKLKDSIERQLQLQYKEQLKSMKEKYERVLYSNYSKWKIESKREKEELYRRYEEKLSKLMMATKKPSFTGSIKSTLGMNLFPLNDDEDALFPDSGISNFDDISIDFRRH